MKKVLYPITHKFVMQKTPWLEDFDGVIEEKMNIDLGAWYGYQPYAVHKMDGGTVRFVVKFAYTPLQIYEYAIMSTDGVQEDTDQQQEYIRFWASSNIWSTYMNYTQLEAPAYGAGNSKSYVDFRGEKYRTMGWNMQMYDISPRGYTGDLDYLWDKHGGGWSGEHTLNGYERMNTDILSIQSGGSPKSLLDIDITFNVPSASAAMAAYLAIPTDYEWVRPSDNTTIHEQWAAGEYVPCVGYGIDMHMQRDYDYKGSGTAQWKTQDSFIWLYDMQVYINGVPSDEFDLGGMSQHDGRLNYKPSGTVNNALFTLGNDSKGNRMIGNQYKYAPWERYPLL